MNCPICGLETRVIYTVTSDEGDSVYRRRKCAVCSHIFYSAEVVIPEDDVDSFKKKWNRAMYVRKQKYI